IGDVPSGGGGSGKDSERPPNIKDDDDDDDDGDGGGSSTDDEADNGKQTKKSKGTPRKRKRSVVDEYKHKKPNRSKSKSVTFVDNPKVRAAIRYYIHTL